jgi:Leu/Phe-tRNA-protein transferase
MTLSKSWLILISNRLERTTMFSLVSNASKIAFVYLVQNMDYELIDCQVENAHLKSLGAFNIERNVFIWSNSRQLFSISVREYTYSGEP